MLLFKSRTLQHFCKSCAHPAGKQEEEPDFSITQLENSLLTTCPNPVPVDPLVPVLKALVPVRRPHNPVRRNPVAAFVAPRVPVLKALVPVRKQLPVAVDPNQELANVVTVATAPRAVVAVLRTRNRRRRIAVL
jgi:hypothetical protein